jgi:UDP-N-acetylmuramoyl-tripeptide--D-alanyl-D-alanine ligase
MQFALAHAASALGLDWPGDESITGWSIDSRTIHPGDLFFALPGANHDGSEFISAALQKGAVAAVSATAGERILTVPDVPRALQDLARWAVQKWGGGIVGVTGSAGKTSTKDIIAAMLAVGFPAGKTEGNFNNHIGLPLSILRLDPRAKAVVLEYGMNHAGEIRSLTTIARPAIAVVTNAGSAHIENFDSMEGIAAAKRELVEALPEDGVAVLNADDPRVAAFAGVHPGRTILYGLSETAEIRAADVALEDGITRFRAAGVEFEMSMPGLHSVRNVLAGIAVASIYGIPAERLREAVRGLQPGKMRGERLTHRGIQIINDCYNSNPDAAKAMLDLLAETPAQRRVAVLGEMLELGRWSEALHRDVGLHAAKSGIAVLIGIRGAARFMVNAAMDSGMDLGAALFFEDPANAGGYLRGIAREGDAILFKGSRGTHVELALECFLA